MRQPNEREEQLLNALQQAELPIRKARREGKTWSEVYDWITRQVGYNAGVVNWAQKVYNDESENIRSD